MPMFEKIAHPFFYPTTIVIIDDNRDFLINLGLQLDEGTACRLFLSPRLALNEINQSTLSNSFENDCLTMNIDELNGSEDEHIVSLNVSAILTFLENPHRFNECSIVIVDYDMPMMNGIEFCKLIQNKAIKKILITGVADEKIAVQAFNDGAIDKFILKNDSSNIERINEYVETFQKEYFSVKTNQVRNTLNNRAFGFLSEPAFKDVFTNICHKYGVVEYYLSSQPNGYVLVTGTGEINHLLILSEADMQAHYEIAQELEAPIELLKLIKERSVIPHFWESDGHYSSEPAEWRKRIFPAELLPTRTPYYYTIIEIPAYYDIFSKSLYKYSDYLEHVGHTYTEPQ